MARLPVYTAQQGIQPAGAPSIPDQGAVGRALQGAGNAIQQVGGQLTDLDLRYAQLQKQNQRYDTGNSWEDLNVNLSNDLDANVRNQAPGANGLAVNGLKQTKDKIDTWLSTVPADLRPQYESKASTLYDTYAGQYAAKEAQGRGQYEIATNSENVTRDQNQAASQPDAIQTILANRKAQIDNMSLLPAQKAALWADAQKNIITSYRDAKYGKDSTKAAAAAGVSTGDVALPKGVIGPGQADRESAAMSYFVGRGYSREQAAGIVGNLVHESGGLNVKSKNPGDGSDGSDSIGIAQWNSTRATNLKAFAAAQGKDWHDLGVQLAFVDHELNTGYSGVKQKLLAAKTPDEAAGVFVTGYERPQGSEGGAAASHGWSNRRDQSRRLAGGNYAPGETEAGSRFTQPSDPLLSVFTPEERQSFVEGVFRQQKVDQAAAATAAVQAQKALVDSLQTDIINNKAGLTDVKSHLDRQQITPDQYLQLQGQIEKRDKEQADTRSFFDTLNSGQKLNPYSADDKKVADAGFKALGGDIDALNTVYGSSGILPPSGVTALRGALISKDSGTVGKALTIASNALARDPNAFTAVDGGNGIENKATTFNHLVNDRGIPTGEAVRQIMEADTAEYKSKIRVNDQDMQEFRKAITPDTIAKQFSGWQVSATNPRGIPNFGSSPTQGAVMMRDYREAAEKHYKETGDADLAQKMAKSDVDKIWGVTNVFGSPTLVNFPVEKTYPGVGVDPNGSHNYVMIQATHEISKQAGQLVAPENLIIAPIPDGSTAQAYYKGQPAPYNVGYMAPDENGYMVPHMLPNPMTFDPNEGHKRAMGIVGPAIDARNAQEQSLQSDVEMERGLGMRGAEALSAPVTAREKPLGQYIPPKPLPKPFSQGAPPTSGNDAFQKTKEEFEQRPNVLPGGLGLGM